MTKTQQTTFLLLLVYGLLYFLAFTVPNSYGARSDAILLESSSDEYVTYPNVIRILTPGKTFFETRANLFLYEDYHYGYPFYAVSALVLLPVRIIFGDAFTQYMQLNLLLLRQFVNILPMLAAVGLLVFMFTRFEEKWKSLALFVFLLSIRGVVRSHIWWWHPDSLTVLCAVLTLFFLDRDRLRFGKNFYFAAAACGLATAIKLLGLFFFLTIPVYVLVGLLQKKIHWQKAAFSSLLFVVVMAGVVVGSNPFLFSDEQRERMLMIQAQKQEELSQGYSHDDPLYYQKGPQWWAPTLEKWYAHPLALIIPAGSLLAGCIWGRRRLLHLLVLTWVLPYSIYVLYFVAVKPDHYWLPVMLPLFACSFTLLDLLQHHSGGTLKAFVKQFSWPRMAYAAIVLFLIGQFFFNLFKPVSGNYAIFQSAVQTGIAQIQAAQ